MDLTPMSDPRPQWIIPAIAATFAVGIVIAALLVSIATLNNPEGETDKQRPAAKENKFSLQVRDLTNQELIDLIDQAIEELKSRDY